ncbi:hypothetical protein PT974_04870 [Cladobotryum mycophilum]|uniref:Uncharacterized protein n=1 Tax=Cladobotryum mycophilum TaxID=491253 RepID=A0ABR0SRK0_9HYPO
MATQAQPYHDPAPSIHEDEEERKARLERLTKLRRVLQTPPDQIFKVSSDGQTYLEPAMLRGVPVAKLDEKSPYWQRSWASLDKLLEKQAPEAEMKEAARRRLLVDPKNAGLLKEHKRLCDNSSKFIKIREVFGPNGRYHPNQLVGKQHLPARGLCQMEEMYKLACKISDMQELHRRGELKMDPFDFIRWRIVKLASGFLKFIGQKSTNIKTIISNLGGYEDPKLEIYQDPFMREAVILSATYRGRTNCYGSRGKKGRNASAPLKATPYPLPPGTEISRSRVRAASSGAETIANTPIAKEEETEEKGSKLPTRPRVQYQSTGYTGVNGYRAKQQRILMDKKRHPDLIK